MSILNHPPKALFDAMKRLCNARSPMTELCVLRWIPESMYVEDIFQIVPASPGTEQRFAVEIGVGHEGEKGAVQIHRAPQAPGELVGWVNRLWDGLEDEA